MKNLLLCGLFLILVLTGCSQKETLNSDNETKNAKTDFINELALHDAIRAKDFNIVQELIYTGSQIDVKDKYGYTPLHLAARLDQYDIAELLIKKGANVNNIDIFKDTPLLDSTRNSTNPMSKLLICNGANRYVVDRHDMSPLHNASKNNDLFIVEMINAKNLTKMCEKLDITLDYYGEDENKICGGIIKGIATKVTLTIVNENAGEEESIQKYDTTIENNRYCALLNKPLDSTNAYILTAVGTNSVDKDIETANLDDLRKAVPAPIVKDEPSEYITGLYEDLMEEFGPDFKPWNAELDKNGLVFRFKKPEVLFNIGSSELRPAFEEILSNFFPRYLKILNKYRDEIEKVRVEGHTSSEYRTAKNDEERYAKNKELSTNRAHSVMDYTINETEQIVNESKEWLDTVYESEGLAYDNLILNEDGTENKILSRRVEFRINKLQQ